MKKYFIFIYVIYSFNMVILANQHEQVFTNIYTQKIWGINDKGEGFSGGGSLLHNCTLYIRLLEKFIVDHNIQTIVDAGCGDWEFSRYVNWHGAVYTGYDVVGYVIEKNIAQYSRDTVNFIHANLLDEDLVSADLLICKDVLQHLSNADIMKFCKQLHKFKYCLITNEVDPRTLTSTGADIKTGETHTVDLSKPPFNISGKPILTYYINGEAHQVFLVDNTKGKRVKRYKN